MGWTSYNATEYKNGKIDRVAEVNKTFADNNETETWKSLKSIAVGSTVYTACEYLNKKTGKHFVFAAITLTSIDSRQNYYNFSYKSMEESMGCYESKCPNSILKLLSPLENIYNVNSNSYEYAKKWRERCIEYNQKKDVLSKLQVGSKIELNYWKPEIPKKILTKIEYFGKKIWTDGSFKYSTKDIKARGYNVI